MEREKHLKEINGYIDKMPSLPASVSKILEICNDPRTSPNDLNQVISIDPVLMGRVMRLINSAYYGMNQKITSLVRAIIMLGINTVKNLALSSAVLGNLGDKKHFQALNMDGFWRHSLCVGVCSKMLAKHNKVDAKRLESFFIAGLLHDIGKIPLNNCLAELYIQAMSLSDRKRCCLNHSEQEVMGINHSEVGEIIAKTWKLGPEVSDALAWHHNARAYEGKHGDIVYTVTLSNFFANYFEIGFSGDRFPQKPDQSIFDALNVTMDWFDEIEDSVLNEIEKARIFLNVSSA